MPDVALLDSNGHILWSSEYQPGTNPADAVGRPAWLLQDTPEASLEIKQAMSEVLLTGERQPAVSVFNGVHYDCLFDRLLVTTTILICKYRKRMVDQFTRREWHVLETLLSDLRAGEAAAKLGITVSTYEAHRRSVLDKAGCKGPAQLAIWARDRGLI